MIRVLIVDDSSTIRKLIQTILEEDPEIQVVGAAGDGEEAIRLCERLTPDLITMDIHMPLKNGYEAIQEIMAHSPRPIVVLTSTESDIRLGVTYQAIDAGALMVLNKPRGIPGQDREADALITQIKAMADVKVVRRRWPSQRRRAERIAVSRASVEKPFRVVAVGASTGGPPAVKEVFGKLPADFPAPILLVQHISQGFVQGLVRWLDSISAISVKVAENREPCRPGVAYVAPDGAHMCVSASGSIWLDSSEPVDGHKPSVTALFQSVAEQFGQAAVGVILTGMGRDGADGLKMLRDAGGYTIAQDKNSCIVFGMPKEAIARGAAVEVLPLTHIGTRLRDMAVRQQKPPLNLL